MKNLKIPHKLGKILLHILIALTLIGAFILAPITANKMEAASATIPLNMIYYGWHDATTDASIINAHPEFLVSCSPAGPWRGNASISKFTAAGIKYFEYIDGGYETTVVHAIPTALQSNLNYTSAAAAAGAYGVFVDCVSSYPSDTGLYYLKQIADRAHSLGLKVVFNTGVDSWTDTLMTYCDFINSSETWNNAALSASQSKWASRTWVLTYNITSATTAAGLTNAAISKGFKAHYACTSYGAFPTWLGTYTAQIYAPMAAATSPTGQATVSFSSNPAGSEVWLDYAYKGLTPLNLSITAGNHHIGFNKYGYHNNIPLEGDFLAGNTSMVVNGDLVSGQITSTQGSSGNTTGTVVGTPIAGGGANEYNFNLKITRTSVSGITVGQQVWCTASITNFSNLLAPGITLSGNLDHSLGWWVFKP